MNPELLATLIGAVTGVLVMFACHKIQDYREDRRYWKSVEKHFEHKQRMFALSVTKALMAATPVIIEYVKKQKEQNGQILRNKTDKQ